MCVGVVLYCQRRREEQQAGGGGGGGPGDGTTKYAALQSRPRCIGAGGGGSPGNAATTNHYVCPADLDIRIPPANLNNKYYSTGSLKRKDSYNKMTVKEATLKRNSLMRTGSLLRTSTNFDHMDRDEF